MSNAYCSHCYQEMPKYANGCPHCGSDEETGWSDNTYLDGVDTSYGHLEDDDYDDYVRREFGDGEGGGNPVWIIVVALVVVVAMVWLSVGF